MEEILVLWNEDESRFPKCILWTARGTEVNQIFTSKFIAIGGNTYFDRKSYPERCSTVNFQMLNSAGSCYFIKLVVVTKWIIPTRAFFVMEIRVILRSITLKVTT